MRRCWRRSASATPAPTIFERGGPYLIARRRRPGAHRRSCSTPTARRCSARSATTTTSSRRSRLRSAATATRCSTHSQILGAANPYVYPDNLPRVNAQRRARRAPGCWQPITRDLWPAPYLVMDTGASIAPYNHFETRLSPRHRVRLGPPGRGEHDQPMKITGTAIKLGIFSLVLLLFTVIIIVVFGQMRFDRTTGYSAVFSNASGLRAGQFVRASGVEVGKVSKVELIDGGRRVGSTSTSTARCRCTSATTASDPLPQPDRRPLPGTQARRGRGRRPGPAAGRHSSRWRAPQPALDLDALIGGFRPLFRALDPEKVNTIARRSSPCSRARAAPSTTSSTRPRS